LVAPEEADLAEVAAKGDKPGLSYPATERFAEAYFDMVNNEVTNDPYSPLGRRCDPFESPDQYMYVYLN
jgi:hypothetical protein